MNILFGVLGSLSLIYYILLVAYAGMGTSFSLFWLLLAVVCGLLSMVWGIQSSRLFLKKLPLWVRVPVRTTVMLALLVFLIVGSMIGISMIPDSDARFDYLVVLGAKVNGRELSKSLKYRLDTAAEYLDEHPETKAVVTGGRGEGEEISEAAAMRDYLAQKGISRKRIYMERYAVNTAQNLEYSLSLISDQEARIGIVTSDFHVFRAVAIGKKAGMEQVQGVPAKTDLIYLPNMMMRECFAVLKDWFMGNI